MNKQEFINFVKNARSSSGLTYYEFAEKLGICWTTGWRWENGHTMPKPDAIEYWIKRINDL